MITDRLEVTRDRLLAIGLDARVAVTENGDQTIDGEILITVPRGTSATEVSQELENAFRTSPLGLGRGGFWFTLGVRLSIHKDEAEDRSGSARIRGMDDLMMYYRRIGTPRLIDSFLREQKIMIPGAERKYKRKVETVYLRLHWNPNNEKPQR